MGKGCLLILLLIVGLFAGAVGLFYSMMKGTSKAGDDLLTLLGTGKVKEAYESTSGALKTQQSEIEFTQKVTDLGLLEYASASWPSRSVNNDRGQLVGTVTTRSGGKIPLHIDLIKESGTWKVFSLSVPVAGVSASASGKVLPSTDELKSTARASLLAFNKAVQEKNFTGFHQQISALWQSQITPEKLLEIFQVFVEKGIDISTVEKNELVFDDRPKVNDDGVLILKGYSPSPAQKVTFELKYIYEDPAWKLSGIDVNVK